MEWKAHGYRVGPHSHWVDTVPDDPDQLDEYATKARKHIEPWLAAVFQSEHLNLLLGSGFTTSIGALAGASPTGMNKIKFNTSYDDKINAHAQATARLMERGEYNIEDQFRSAIALLEGLKILGDANADALQSAMDAKLHSFLLSLLATERGIVIDPEKTNSVLAVCHLQSFLLSFASRVASRERLHIFTTNYDRLVEYGCDLAGLRTIDRFVGALNPVFRSSRVEVDVHYNPPGIRGEPRFMEGVIRLSKLHGSLDWHWDKKLRRIQRKSIPFGAADNHSDIPKEPIDTVMVYPNPAKDVETTAYPYAELFRDFAAALCRPNSVVVSYGYGFGDDHINRVLADMLTIPSTHLVIIGYDVDDRLKHFCENIGKPAQISLLAGKHFANMTTLVEHYLPKPALDFITGRMTEIMKTRPHTDHSPAVEAPSDVTAGTATPPDAKAG